MNPQHQTAATIPVVQGLKDRQSTHAAATPHLPPRQRARGFTWTELLVVIAIIAIFASFAIPLFQALIANTSVSSAVNVFVSDTRYARGEAMRRGKSVTICRSAAPLANVPKCSTGDGLAAGGWIEGWVVFVDENGDGSFDSAARGPGDTVVRVQEPLFYVGNFFAVSNAGNPVNNRSRIVYDATGRAIAQAGRWLVRAPGALGGDNAYARTLCMNWVGRVYIQAGAVPCH